ncbi:response regulator [Myxococcus xanthus DK 1622]|uniref:Response regulator n=2 Tax=Myxococcus xanthus TaxID=34 RepID=Q1D1Y1_MYXXD|nr:response regulator [Myxococcus xanthus DK 1622]
MGSEALASGKDESPPPRGFLKGMGAERIKVLLVEDDGDSRELLAELLESEFDVKTATDGLAGLEMFEAEHPDVVVTDESLPGMCGTELAQKVKEREPRARVILVSGYTQVQGSEHCDVVLRKPIDVERLSAAVCRLGDEARH